MAKRKAIEVPSSDAAAKPNSKTDDVKSGGELPVVESPATSPATEEAVDPVVEPVAASADAETAIVPQTNDKVADAAPAIARLINFPRFNLRRRHKRFATLAASMTIAAAFGAVIGVAATGSYSKAPDLNAAMTEQNEGLQQSFASLSKEVASLKANVETASKSASSQFAKLSERLSRERSEFTGSITPPQTVPSAQAAPLPAARPAHVNAETPPRLPVVQDWSIRETRDGYVYVQGHGDIYQVTPGAPLPGLGPVEQIKRQDGRWLVVTPKGIIVSMRDRRYFEQF